MYQAGVQPFGPEAIAAFLGAAFGTAFLGAAFGTAFLGAALGTAFLGAALGTAFLGAAFGTAFLGAVFLMGVFFTGAALACVVFVVFLAIVFVYFTVFLGWLLVLVEERTLALAIFFPIKRYYSLQAVNPKQAFLPNQYPPTKADRLTAQQHISPYSCPDSLQILACLCQNRKNDKYQHCLILWRGRGPPKSLKISCFFWLQTAGSSGSRWWKGEILLPLQPLLFWGLLPQNVNISGNPLIGVPLTAKAGGVFSLLTGVIETGFILKAFPWMRQVVLRRCPICWLSVVSGGKESQRKVALVVCSVCSFWGKRGVEGVYSLELSAKSSSSSGMNLGVCEGKRGVAGVSLIF